MVCMCWSEMENIPYVFEMVRIQRGCDGKVSLTFEEYDAYLKVFEELCESKRKELFDRVKKNRAECERV